MKKPPLILVVLVIVWIVVLFVWMNRKSTPPPQEAQQKQSELEDRVLERCLDTFDSMENEGEVDRGECWGTLLSNVGLLFMGEQLKWLFSGPIMSTVWIAIFLLTIFFAKKWMKKYFEEEGDEKVDDEPELPLLTAN